MGWYIRQVTVLNYGYFHNQIFICIKKIQFYLPDKISNTLGTPTPSIVSVVSKPPLQNCSIPQISKLSFMQSTIQCHPMIYWAPTMHQALEPIMWPLVTCPIIFLSYPGLNPMLQPLWAIWMSLKATQHASLTSKPWYIHHSLTLEVLSLPFLAWKNSAQCPSSTLRSLPLPL